MAGIESLIGGFVRGIAQGRRMKFERERQAEKDKQQKAMMDLQRKALEIQVKERDMQIQRAQNANLMLNQLGMLKPEGGESGKPGEIGGVEKTGFAPSFQQSAAPGGTNIAPGKTAATGGVTDQLAIAQLAFMNPMVAEYLKASGLNIPSMSKAALDRLGFMRDYQRGKMVKVPDGKGGWMHMWVGQFDNPMSSARLMGTETPDTEWEEREQGGRTERRIVNKKTKQPMSDWMPRTGKKAMSAESAGKLGMVQSGYSDLKLAKDILMPDGKVTNETYMRLAEMSMPGPGMPFSKGRDAKSYFLNAMEGKIRIESGAAVPDEEIVRLALRFMPKLGDSKSLIKSKITRLEEYLSGVIQKLDPNKQYGSAGLVFTSEEGERYVWMPGKVGQKKKTLNDPLGLRK